VPATNCTNPVQFDFSRDNQLCQFLVELTWDGTSTPPNCDGTVSRVVWNNTGSKTWYAHLPGAKGGPAVYRIDPGSTGEVTSRATLHAAGLDTRADLYNTGTDGMGLNEIPPQANERLVN
jgi:hypothetical protein